MKVQIQNFIFCLFPLTPLHFVFQAKNLLILGLILTHDDKTKPIISFNSKPTVFNSNLEDKNPPKKIPAKAKKRSKNNTGKETKTNNKITNYFLGSTAAADKTNLTLTKTPSEKIDFSDMAQRFADS